MGQAKRRKQKLGALYGTPEGSNRSSKPQGRPGGITSEALSTYLTRDQQQEVVTLLLHGPESWERRYQPVPSHSDEIAEVVLRCDGELSFMELVPRT